MEGRDFDDTHQPVQPPAVIINAHLAKTYFGSKDDPLGRFITQESGKARVIGVVSDVRDQGLRSAILDTVYQNANQLLASSLTLLARCNGPCGPLMTTLRKSISTMDANTPILAMHTMQTEISGTLSNEQILGLLSALFALLAVLLTAAGLYGITSYAVTCRTREIGLRLAIGASLADITRLLSKETAILVAIGVCAGVPAALAAVQYLRSQLFGVTPYDPVALAASVLGIAATAFFACLAPLRRALRISPQQALRVE